VWTSRWDDNHRSHGHYLARFGDVKGLLAEIMGKRGAVGNGVGGSQHIYHRRFLSTGIQGELVPVAAGVAMCLNRERSSGVAVAFIGDGTWGEGGVYEALNIAQLWSLPVLVVVENNRIAQSTPSTEHMAGSVAGRAQAFGIPWFEVHSQDVNEIRAIISAPIAAVRSTRRPAIIEFHTQRLGPHSKGDDTRGPEEIAELHRRDWYTSYRRVDAEQLAHLESKVQAELDRIVTEVEEAPFSEWRNEWSAA